ncbi:endolytic transglycosylase MltG [Bacillus sp. FJAT-49736]|uniref:endolytic transglycosylase MltG n=1 Tax=Bacillus sp. FJAT-49736 TaxID=2833582 RepID=UPI00201648DA|nr:endolytic transglycosylase MltG [Bacillus sp. FJAT-49736]
MVKQAEARTIRRIVSIISLSILLIIGGLILAGYIYVQSSLKPVDSKNHEFKKVVIPIGSSVSSIGSILEDKGIVKNGIIFKYYVKFNNETGFQAGTYQLSPSMTMEQIVKYLKTGKVEKNAEVKITIPEGIQLSEIAVIIAKNTNYKSVDIMKQIDDQKYVKKLMKEYPTLLSSDILKPEVKHPLEGYLFPATYYFYEKKPSLNTIIAKMLDKTNAVMEKYQDDMNKKKLTPQKLLTMASLIEEEATSKADRHKISSVFYNRIKVGMPLQTDPTILYSLNKHKERVTYKDLEVNSPYNTYKITGLPPSPIANAGELSIEAAIHPANTDYLYFLAASNTGKVYFSKTLAEHNQLKAKYITNQK